MLLVTILALSAMRMPIRLTSAIPSDYLTFGDNYMAGPHFSHVYDAQSTGSISRTDVAGPGVSFNLSGFSGKIMIGDNYPCYIPGAAPNIGNDSLTAYSMYILYMTNVGTNAVDIHLYMNTGYSTPDPTRDTFWAGQWATLNPGETRLYKLDFAYAQTYNAEDDPNPAWQYTDGTWNSVHRLDETTNIGIEFGYWGAGTINPKVIAFAYPTTLIYIQPPTTNKEPADVCTSFTVDIVIENFTDFYGFDIEVSWDSTIISFTSAKYTSHLNSLWGSGLWTTIMETSTTGSYKLVAVSLDDEGVGSTAASALFDLTLHVDKSCNFPLQTWIHFDKVDLSDSAEPVPNRIPATITDGMYYMNHTPPALVLAVSSTGDPLPYEYCDTIEVEVQVTNISSCTLEDYNITVTFNNEWLRFVDVDVWGILGDNLTGNANYTHVGPGKVRVWDTGGLTFSNGDAMLFVLTFHVEFTGEVQKIWRTCQQHSFDIDFWFLDVHLSFAEGNLNKGETIVNEPLTIAIELVRGDVHVDGQVTMEDISDAAFWYEQLSPDERYDLDCDGDVDLYDIVVIASNYGYGVP